MTISINTKIRLFTLCLAWLITPKISAQQLNTEILVVGGTLSGTTAGIEAARQGVKTIIVEETSWLGGTLSAAGASQLPARAVFESGIVKEFRDSLTKRYSGTLKLTLADKETWHFRPDEANDIFKNMAANESALRTYYSVKLVALKKVLPNREIVPNTEGGWLVTLRDEKGNFFKINTRILIDASEAGDALKMAGGKYTIGADDPRKTGEEDCATNRFGWLQSLTYTAPLEDVEGVAAKMGLPTGYDPSVWQCLCADFCPEKRADLPSCGILFKKMRVGEGHYVFNLPQQSISPDKNWLEADEKSRSEIFSEAKKQMLKMLYFFQNDAGFNDFKVAKMFPTRDSLPFYPVLRDGRRANGLARLTANQLRNPYVDDLLKTSVGVGAAAMQFMQAGKTDTAAISCLPNTAFGLPMGCLIPDDLDNFLVAERNVSVTSFANGATNDPSVVMQLGQAAGVVAAVAVRELLPVKSVSPRRIQEILTDKGVFVMPFTDLKPESKHFNLLQRVGATGLLRGRVVATPRAMRFDFLPDSLVSQRDLDDIMPLNAHASVIPGDEVAVPTSSNPTIEVIIGWLWRVGKEKLRASSPDWNDAVSFRKYTEKRWKIAGLTNFDPVRPLTRLELALLLDDLFHPFETLDVDFQGNFKYGK